ncbi:MAG: hypothetical protein GX606_05160 [Elusimicrobia bacterium]|nr:hypothetical protein [Elusimicrobiota bacterium]
MQTTRGKFSRAQSTLEYAVLVTIVVAALLSMQIYMKRGIQGKLQSSTDDIGDQFETAETNYWKRSESKTVVTETTNGEGTNTDYTCSTTNVTETFTTDNTQTTYMPQ